MWELYPPLMDLCNIVYLPTYIFEYCVGLVYGKPVNLVRMSTYIKRGSQVLQGIGILLVILGTETWLYGKYQRKKVIDFWIYTYSRHPQYLGFLVWSYGLLLYPYSAIGELLNPARNLPGAMFWDYPIGGFPWLVLLLTVVCLGLWEDIQLLRRYGTLYKHYRDRTPFFLPLPQVSKQVIKFPARVVLQKPYPETGTDIIIIFFLYLALLLLFSLPFISYSFL